MALAIVSGGWQLLAVVDNSGRWQWLAVVEQRQQYLACDWPAKQIALQGGLFGWLIGGATCATWSGSLRTSKASQGGIRTLLQDRC